MRCSARREELERKTEGLLGGGRGKGGCGGGGRGAEVIVLGIGEEVVLDGEGVCRSG